MIRWLLAALVLFAPIAHADVCPAGDADPSGRYWYQPAFAVADSGASNGYTMCSPKFKRLEEAEYWMRHDARPGLSANLELAFPIPNNLASGTGTGVLDYRPFAQVAGPPFYRPPFEYLTPAVTLYVAQWPPATVNANCTSQQNACQQPGGWCSSTNDELQRATCQIQSTWNTNADYCWNLAGNGQVTGSFSPTPTAIHTATYTDPTGQGRNSGDLIFDPSSSTAYDSGVNMQFPMQRCTGTQTETLKYGMRQKLGFFCAPGLRINTNTTDINKICYSPDGTDINGFTGSAPNGLPPAPYKMTVGTPPNPQTIMCGEGDPCMPGSGNTLVHERGFRYGNIKFDLHYNSLRNARPFAYIDRNWSHTFAKRILTSALTNGHVIPSSLIHVQDDEAHLETYVQTSTQTIFRSSNGAGRALKAEGRYGGQWDLYEIDGTVEVYDMTGRLTGIVDPDNPSRTLRITYLIDSTDSYPPPAHWRTATVTDGNGRSIAFQYSGEPDYWLTSIVGDDGSVLMSFHYDEPAHILTAVTQPNGVRRYVYNEPAHVQADLPYALTAIVDESQHRYATFEYDDYGRATGSWHGVSAEKISLDYIDNTEVDVTMPLGETRIYDFSNHNPYLMPDIVSDEAGDVHYLYDGDHRLQQKVDKRNVTTNYEYSDPQNVHESARVEAVDTSSQRRVESDWDGTSNRLHENRIYEKNGASWSLDSKMTYVYDATSGQLLTATRTEPITGQTQTVTNAYCTAADVTNPDLGCAFVGQLESVDGARRDVSDVTRFAYYTADAADFSYRKGDLKSLTDALGRLTTFATYDRRGNPLRTIDSNGTITDFTYMPRGWLHTRTVRANADGSPSGLDATIELQYDVNGNVKTVIQADNSATYLSYDTANRLIKISDLLGNSIDYCPGGEGSSQCIDAMGHRLVEQYKDSTGVLRHSLTHLYSQLGLLLATFNAAGQAVQSFQGIRTPPQPYDGNDNPTHFKDGLGTETVQQFDPLNRLSATIADAANSNAATGSSTTTFARDTRDNLRSITDADNVTTTYDYDGLDNLTGVHSPDSGDTTYTYDDAGNRTKQHDARGVDTHYLYDTLNRLKGVTYPTSSLNVTIAYDQPNSVTGCAQSYPIGRMTTMTDSSGSMTFCYDRRGNVTGRVQTTGASTYSLAISYTLADKVASITYPSGAVVAYTRNAAGLVSGVSWKAPGLQTSTPIVGNATYYPYGPLNVLTFANGRTLTKTYDLDYAIDNIVSSASDGLVLDLGVDTMGQVTSASDTLNPAVPKRSYVYDPLSRLTRSASTFGILELYTYSKGGDRLSKKLGGQAQQSYAYTPLSHRLAGVDGVARTYTQTGNQTDDGSGYVYTYDDRNRPSTLTRPSDTIGFAYNGEGQRVQQAIASPGFGTLTTRMVYGNPGQRLAETRYDTTGKKLDSTELIYLGSTPVALVQYNVNGKATLSYIEADQLGTPRVIADPATNAWQWKWDYLASTFGEQDPTTNMAATAATNMRFPGQQNEAGNAYYNFQRDYQASVGRYIESDPIGLAGGLNPYAYVGSNPLGAIDPSGLNPYDDFVECFRQYAQHPGEGGQDCLRLFVLSEVAGARAEAYREYKQVCRVTVKGITCVTTCVLTSFIGIDVSEIVLNAHKKAMLEAAKRAAEEMAIKWLKRFVPVIDAIDTLNDTRKTIICTTNCMKS